MTFPISTTLHRIIGKKNTDKGLTCLYEGFSVKEEFRFSSYRTPRTSLSLFSTSLPPTTLNWSCFFIPVKADIRTHSISSFVRLDSGVMIKTISVLRSLVEIQRKIWLVTDQFPVVKRKTIQIVNSFVLFVLEKIVYLGVKSPSIVLRSSRDKM